MKILGRKLTRQKYAIETAKKGLMLLLAGSSKGNVAIVQEVFHNDVRTSQRMLFDGNESKKLFQVYIPAPQISLWFLAKQWWDKTVSKNLSIKHLQVWCHNQTALGLDAVLKKCCFCHYKNVAIQQMAVCVCDNTWRSWSVWCRSRMCWTCLHFKHTTNEWSKKHSLRAKACACQCLWTHGS